MANLNKVMLIGRLTRDPEPIQKTGGEVIGAKFGFAVNDRKLNKDTQQWEDTPVYVDVEAWNRGENQMAVRILDTLKKGQQVYIEGRLKFDQWDDSNGGGKRQKLGVTMEVFQYLEPRADGQAAPANTKAAPAPARGGKTNGRSAPKVIDYPDDDGGRVPAGVGGEDEIPF